MDTIGTVVNYCNIPLGKTILHQTSWRITYYIYKYILCMVINNDNNNSENSIF